MSAPIVRYIKHTNTPTHTRRVVVCSLSPSSPRASPASISIVVKWLWMSSHYFDEARSPAHLAANGQVIDLSTETNHSCRHTHTHTHTSTYNINNECRINVVLFASRCARVCVCVCVLATFHQLRGVESGGGGVVGGGSSVNTLFYAHT